MTFKFTKEQEEFITLLEVTDAPQCTGGLFDGKGYCCLGLYSIMQGATVESIDKRGIHTLTNGKRYELSYSLKQKLNLYYANGAPEAHMENRAKNIVALVELNDFNKFTFKEIAAHLREYPECYFKPNEETDNAKT